MTDFRLDHSGVAELLKSAELAREVHAAAEKVAAAARAQGRTTSDGKALPIVVDDYVTDRAASSVTVAHPAAVRVEAKYGLLSKAAAAAGLEVNS